MTAKEIYDGVLVEMKRLNANSFALEEFNHFVNKVLRGFANDRYKVYQKTQQLSDDLRVLRKRASFITQYGPTGILNQSNAAVVIAGAIGDDTVSVSRVSDLKVGGEISLNEVTYTISTVDSETNGYPYVVGITPALTKVVPIGTPVFLPASNDLTPDTSRYTGYEAGTEEEKYTLELPSADYFHLLSCRTFWEGTRSNGKKTLMNFPAKRLTDDAYDAIVNNVYLRPKFSRPYYQVEETMLNSGVIMTGSDVDISEYHNRLTLELNTGATALQGPSRVSGMNMTEVKVIYLKLPATVTLQEMDIFTTGEDTSQVLEFPGYLLNKFVTDIAAFLLEANGAKNFQTHLGVNQAIGDIPTVQEVIASTQPSQPPPEAED